MAEAKRWHRWPHASTGCGGGASHVTVSTIFAVAVAVEASSPSDTDLASMAPHKYVYELAAPMSDVTNENVCYAF